jgi:hypothetical protein
MMGLRPPVRSKARSEAECRPGAASNPWCVCTKQNQETRDPRHCERALFASETTPPLSTSEIASPPKGEAP